MYSGIVVDQELVDAAKLARRMKTTAYDTQVEALLNAAMLDLGVAGVETDGSADALIRQAAITYFLMHFGQPEDYDRLKRSYDEQKAQLASATGYTVWTDQT